MSRSQPTRDASRRVRFALIGLAACCLISCDDATSARGVADAAPNADAGDVTTHPDAGAGAREAAAPDAVADAAPLAGRATARATLVSRSPRSDIPPVAGTAEFRVTSSGVDLELHMNGCQSAPPYPITIVEASDCAQAAGAPTWSDGGGENVPGAYCIGTSATGSTFYSRSNALPTRWSVGDGARSDVVGRAVIVHDPVTAAMLSCGVIEKQPDTVFTAQPPLDQAPSVATRAQIAGSCIVQTSLTLDDPNCPDERGVVDCASEHCDLGSCVAACAGSTPCLDLAPDKCAALLTCSANAACSDCMAKLWQCSAGYCSHKLFCSVTPTVDGPCDQFRSCCALQGAGAGPCLDTFKLLFDVGGDPSCRSAQTDWDVIAHMAVPCKFESVPPAVSGGKGRDAGAAPVDGGSPLEGASCESDADCGGLSCVGAVRGAIFSAMGSCRARPRIDPLGAGVAGRACQDDSGCGSGRCEGRAPIGIGFPDNLCTGDCYADADCGAGGACLWLGRFEPGLCLQSCASDADCGRDGYRCMAFGDGRRELGACYPMPDRLPDGVAGRACASDSECAGRAGSCRSELSLLAFGGETAVAAPKGYCSEGCYFDADCGKDAYCISGGPTGGLCFAHCTASVKCRDGYECVPHPRGFDPTAMACIPATTTTPAP